jgi:hypothetical protein
MLAPWPSSLALGDASTTAIAAIERSFGTSRACIDGLRTRLRLCGVQHDTLEHYSAQPRHEYVTTMENVDSTKPMTAMRSEQPPLQLDCHVGSAAVMTTESEPKFTLRHM